jgi:hypothetical protein
VVIEHRFHPQIKALHYGHYAAASAAAFVWKPEPIILRLWVEKTSCGVNINLVAGKQQQDRRIILP